MAGSKRKMYFPPVLLSFLTCPNNVNCPAGAAGGRSRKFAVAADAVPTTASAATTTIVFLIVPPSFSRRQRAADLQPSLRTVVCVNRPTRGRDHVLHDREAEPGSTRGPRAVGAVETLEEAWEVLVGDAAPGIGAGEDDAAVLGPHREREGRPRAGVADRVLRQVGRHDLEHALPERQLDRGRAVERELDARALGALAEAGEDAVKDGQRRRGAER